MKTILYARVSTADQTLDHQLTQAEGAGFKIDTVVTDRGVSGVSTKLAERPQLNSAASEPAASSLIR